MCRINQRILKIKMQWLEYIVAGWLSYCPCRLLVFGKVGGHTGVFFFRLTGYLWAVDRNAKQSHCAS